MCPMVLLLSFICEELNSFRFFLLDGRMKDQFPSFLNSHLNKLVPIVILGVKKLLKKNCGLVHVYCVILRVGQWLCGYYWWWFLNICVMI